MSAWIIIITIIIVVVAAVVVVGIKSHLTALQKLHMPHVLLSSWFEGLFIAGSRFVDIS